jgi:tetratricopeptide (TPR) repeat protein
VETAAARLGALLDSLPSGIYVRSLWTKEDWSGSFEHGREINKQDYFLTRHGGRFRYDARATAMDYCRKAPTNKNARSLCKVIDTFSNRCVAVSMDPKAGTPGVGWGIGDDLRVAERLALSKCEATAGAGRRAARVVTESNCDGQANAANCCQTLSGDAAIAACDEAILKDPKSAALFNNRGFEYRNKGDADRALTDFNKALELNPKYAIALNNRANVYRDRGDTGRALADYSSAIESNPKYDLAYFNRVTSISTAASRQGSRRYQPGKRD